MRIVDHIFVAQDITIAMDPVKPMNALYQMQFHVSIARFAVC